MPSRQASQETLRDVYAISWLGEMEKAVRFSGCEAGTLGRCKSSGAKKAMKRRQKRTGTTQEPCQNCAATPQPQIWHDMTENRTRCKQEMSHSWDKRWKSGVNQSIIVDLTQQPREKCSLRIAWNKWLWKTGATTVIFLSLQCGKAPTQLHWSPWPSS